MVKDVRVRLLQLLQFMLLTTSSTAAENATRAPLGRIVAYIGVRDGSQRCPRKNIKAFWGDDASVQPGHLQGMQNEAASFCGPLLLYRCYHVPWCSRFDM